MVRSRIDLSHPERMSSVQYILCINSGSSSLKYALYRMAHEDETLLAQGAVERIGLEGGSAWVRTGIRSSPVERNRDFPDHRNAVREAFDQLQKLCLASPTAVGHRVVHGGASHFEAAKVDENLVAELKGICGYAPLHLPAEIDGIEAVAGNFPGLPQVACFDTAFHRRMPNVAQRFPLEQVFWLQGLRRYGFHGLSYEYVLDALGPHAMGRVIIAHLGSGASLAAVYDRHPVDTTMGFTPTGGFMMGTRSGDLDPGVILYLMHEKEYSSRQVEDLVNRKAGLLGVSGITPDMKTLLALMGKDARAAAAVEMFCYQVRKHIGSLAAALGGLDTLVFTGGIGERAAPVRSAICGSLAHLGITLDEGRNATNADLISTPSGACEVRIVRTNEDLMIARQTFALLTR